MQSDAGRVFQPQLYRCTLIYLQYVFLPLGGAQSYTLGPLILSSLHHLEGCVCTEVIS